MTDGKISVKMHESPLSSHLLGGGTIQISEASRSPEEALGNYQPPATDTQGDEKRAGLTRCERCKVAKAPDEYRKRKFRGVEYQCKFCKQCESDMARTHRFSDVMAKSPYPDRLLK